MNLSNLSPAGLTTPHISIIMTHQHWTELLPEVGKFSRNGQRMATRYEELQKARNEVKRLEIEYEQEEIRLLEEAKLQWSIEEIDEAMINATK